jgi:hypothetical protein
MDRPYSIGIVGHEGSKFTPAMEMLARSTIVKLIRLNDPSVVVSGACHLGGIDIWAIEEARNLGVGVIECPPKTLSWDEGYKPRNMEIARLSAKVYSLVLKELPPTYKGMRFTHCYHCKTNTHIKSGGCWTARYAGRIGKTFEIVEL